MAAPADDASQANDAPAESASKLEQPHQLVQTFQEHGCISVGVNLMQSISMACSRLQVCQCCCMDNEGRHGLTEKCRPSKQLEAERGTMDIQQISPISSTAGQRQVPQQQCSHFGVAVPCGLFWANLAGPRLRGQLLDQDVPDQTQHIPLVAACCAAGG